MSLTVDHLRKVHLQIEAGSSPGERDLTPTPRSFIFICGAASAGMCPFEYQLVGKAAGEQLDVSIPAARLSETMAHLLMPLRRLLDGAAIPPVLSLTVTIDRVSEPAPREVIRAMAEATNAEGCGGDCSCGCGGH
jgi:hypothetical protein